MVYIATDHGWIDENFERLARVVKEYDDYLELGWIPPDKRTREDKEPYCIIDTRINQPVMYATADAKPHEILARLIMADNKDESVLAKIEAEEAAQKLLQMQEWNDSLAEGHDISRFLFNTPLYYVRMGKDELGKPIKMDDTRRRI